MPIITIKEDFAGYEAGRVDVPDAVYWAAKEANVLGEPPAKRGKSAKTSPLAAFPQLTDLTVEQVRTLDDAALLAIDGVTADALPKIREAVAE